MYQVGLTPASIATSSRLSPGVRLRPKPAWIPEWVAALSRAGFVVTSTRPRALRMEFSSWIARTRAPELHARAIRSLQARAPAEVREHFRSETDGSFMLEALLIEASSSTPGIES